MQAHGLRDCGTFSAQFCRSEPLRHSLIEPWITRGWQLELRDMKAELDA